MCLHNGIGVEVKQDKNIQHLQVQKDEKGDFILYRAMPNEGVIELSAAS